MNYRNPQLIDELAAHYALGTLRGPARRRFEKLCANEPIAMSALHRWENRFVALLSEVKPATPSAQVWKQIQRRLSHAQEKRSVFDALFGWLGARSHAFAAGAAVLILTIAMAIYIAIPRQQVLATIANQQHAEEWRVLATKDRDKLSIARSGAIALVADRDYELWALLDSGAPPVSLGLMPKNGKRDLQLNEAQRRALNSASKIAISLEPIGGSPTGAPTGPVLFVADIARAPS